MLLGAVEVGGKLFGSQEAGSFPRTLLLGNIIQGNGLYLAIPFNIWSSI